MEVLSDKAESDVLKRMIQVAYNRDASGKKGLLSSIHDESGRTVTYAYSNRNELYSVAD